MNWTVRNAGTRELVIDQVRMSCACESLHRALPGGGTEKLIALRLQPGESQELRWPLTIRGSSGQSQAYRVLFRTNDPRQPESSFTVHIRQVRGNLRMRPSVVSMAAAPVDRAMSTTVTLIADRTYPDDIERVVAGHPWCQAELVPAPVAAEGQEKAVCGCRVSVRLPEAGAFQTELAFHTKAGEVYRLPVSARAIDHVEAWPKTVVLPRTVQGKVVWSQEVRLEAITGEPVEVGPIQAPNGVRVEVIKGALPMIRLTVADEGMVREALSVNGETSVTGTATAGKKASRFRVRILLRGTP